LAEDLQVAARAWRRIVKLVVIAGFVATAIAVLAGVVAGRAITRPIRTVTRTAHAIAAGDYDRRVTPEGPAEINELSLAFNGMVEEVLSQRRVERDLLANISHELASPLGLIRGYAEALAEGVIEGGPQQLAALRSIRAETGRLERLTADLLDLALLETGQVSMQVEEVPVGELLAGLQERFTPLAQQAGVTVSVDVPAGLPPLHADGLRLEQVLVNLLNNALRHTPARGTIAMAARRNDRGLYVTVSDTGSGIPAEELPRIWERFYRVDQGRDRRDHEAGVGLGLAICRSTIALMHGTIIAESAPGTGTTFTLWLPLRAPRAEGTSTF
jgi:signal transduction histidine kinase